MITTAPVPHDGHTSFACHLGLHEWAMVRDDEERTHYVCVRGDAAKPSNDPWWEFAAEAGTGFH